MARGMPIRPFLLTCKPVRKKPAIAEPTAPQKVDALGKAAIDPEDGDESADETKEEEQQEEDEQEALEQDSVDEAVNAERAPVKKAEKSKPQPEERPAAAKTGNVRGSSCRSDSTGCTFPASWMPRGRRNVGSSSARLALKVLA